MLYGLLKTYLDSLYLSPCLTCTQIALSGGWWVVQFHPFCGGYLGVRNKMKMLSCAMSSVWQTLDTQSTTLTRPWTCRVLPITWNWTTDVLCIWHYERTHIRYQPFYFVHRLQSKTYLVSWLLHQDISWLFQSASPGMTFLTRRRLWWSMSTNWCCFHSSLDSLYL